MIVEVCANSLQSAINAEKGGADRIELCVELGVGGITPSYGLLRKVREAVTIPIHVLIRPRSGDFTYSDAEFEVMCADIAQCALVGCDGIVSGVLDDKFQPDLARTGELVSLSGNMHFTFHRAFDWISDPLSALQQLEGIGVDAILSSGQEKSAPEGMPLLLKLKEQAKKCSLMPGGGIRESNARQFKKSGFRAIHLSAISIYQHHLTHPKISMNAPDLISDTCMAVSDEAEVRAVVESVK